MTDGPTPVQQVFVSAVDAHGGVYYAVCEWTPQEMIDHEVLRNLDSIGRGMVMEVMSKIPAPVSRKDLVWSAQWALHWGWAP